MIKPGDLVTYVNPSKLLPSLDVYQEKSGIVIKEMDPDCSEKFYMIHWGDTICCIMEDNLKIIQHAHHIHTGENNECREQDRISVKTRASPASSDNP